jgi:hypothetical protein
MKIDTEIRPVTKPGANLFLELGFAPDEARRLQAASRKQINDTRLLKKQLMKGVIRMDHETSFEAGRGRRNSDGLAPARLRRGEQENGEVHHRYARGNAQPCGQTSQAGDRLTPGS